MSGLIELFELLEIKSEIWENRTEKREKSSSSESEATKSGGGGGGVTPGGGGGGGSSAGDKDAWSPETAGTDKTDVEDSSGEVRSSSGNTNFSVSVSVCGSASAAVTESGGSCGSVVVKTEVNTDAVEVANEEDTVNSGAGGGGGGGGGKTERRRRRSSSFPVNLSLSNPDNREHSNLQSPASDRESLVSTAANISLLPLSYI